jgi:hypothetical protein
VLTVEKLDETGAGLKHVPHKSLRRIAQKSGTLTSPAAKAKAKEKEKKIV